MQHLRVTEFGEYAQPQVVTDNARPDASQISRASLERRADYNYPFRRRFVSHGLSEK